jgi:hypothetical protein
MWELPRRELLLHFEEKGLLINIEKEVGERSYDNVFKPKAIRLIEIAVQTSIHRPLCLSCSVWDERERSG